MRECGSSGMREFGNSGMWEFGIWDLGFFGEEFSEMRNILTSFRCTRLKV